MAAAGEYAPLESLVSYLEDMSNTLSVVHRLIEDGRAVDLAGLDGQIGLLCAKALDLPSAQWPIFRPGLIRLLAQVDAVCLALSSDDRRI
jgi:hypothetical protein